MAIALSVALLVGGGVALILRRGMMRAVVGFILLGHGANLMLFSAGGTERRLPALASNPDPAVTADPLPQAFVLTAIVIAFSVTVYMLVLSVVGDEDDDTEIEIAGRESETPDLLEEHELPPLDAEDLRHLDPTDAADYERRRLHGHGHLERAHGWSEEDW